MSFWQILRPQAGQNLITNPSFENLTTTGWTTVSSLISIWKNHRYRGAVSARVTPGGSNAGVYYTFTLPTGGDHTFSIYGVFPVGKTFTLRFADTGGTTVGTVKTFSGTGTSSPFTWQREFVTEYFLTTGPYRVYIQQVDSSPGQWFIDAAQLEFGAEPTTYIDGDEDGCIWDGRPYNSTSTRSNQSTAGGVWLDFETDLGIIPLEMEGVGMPPIDNVATPYALLPGARFERALARSRVFTILCLVPGSTWQNMHALREALIGRVQPDQTARQQPIYLRYTGSAEPQIIAAFYDGGLEFGQPDGFAERVPLRFVAHDPFWYSEQDEALLTTSGVFTTDISYAGFFSTTPSTVSSWQSLAASLNGNVDQIVEDTDGTLIFVGNFTNAGGVAAADYVARYNAVTGTWSSIGTAGADARVWCAAVRNDRIIVGGDFANIGGVAAVRIASYDRSSNTWSAFGAGANNSVRSLALTVGYLVVGGNFTSIGGTAANRIAHYNTGLGTWAAIGTGLNGIANVIQLTSPVSSSAIPTYYVGGAFTTAAGTTVNRIAYYNGSTFVAMGATGVNNTVNALALTQSGQLYVGGAFTTAGSVNAQYIALWTGTGWQALPSGPTGMVSALTIDRSNRLYTSATGFNGLLGVVAIYDGGAWLPTYHTIIDSAVPTIMIITRSNLWFVGGPTGTTADETMINAAVNSGTAPTWAIARNLSLGFYNFTGMSGFWLNNTNPAVDVDGREGMQSVVLSDDQTTNAAQFIVPGSQFATLRLLPGGNSIAKYANFSSGYLVWRPRNWSLDV